jgi:hypothetical protein
MPASDVVMGKLVKDMTPDQRERRRASAKRWYENNREHLKEYSVNIGLGRRN